VKKIFFRYFKNSSIKVKIIILLELIHIKNYNIRSMKIKVDKDQSIAFHGPPVADPCCTGSRCSNGDRLDIIVTTITAIQTGIITLHYYFHRFGCLVNFNDAVKITAIVTRHSQKVVTRTYAVHD
jgi:hypothetical protein